MLPDDLMRKSCFICGFYGPAQNEHGEASWTRPGLCRICASLGLDWKACKPCGKPIVWALTEKLRKPIPVDCRPPAGMVPNIVLLTVDSKLIARHAHPEYIRLNVTPGSGLRTGVAHHATCSHGNALRRR